MPVRCQENKNLKIPNSQKTKPQNKQKPTKKTPQTKTQNKMQKRGAQKKPAAFLVW